MTVRRAKTGIFLAAQLTWTADDQAIVSPPDCGYLPAFVEAGGGPGMVIPTHFGCMDCRSCKRDPA